MNKEKLIYDTILEKAHGVNRTTRPVHGQGQCDMAYEILNMVEKIINTEPKNNGWIPCSERLPEEDFQYFNVTIKRADGRYIVEYCLFKLHANKFYIVADGEDELNQAWEEEIEVIAWQPLPQPYKGE